jgi:hypothetical protein
VGSTPTKFRGAGASTGFDSRTASTHRSEVGTPRLLLIAALVLACAPTSDTHQLRDRIGSALRDTLGAGAQPSVGFLDDRQHLQILLSPAPFAGSSDTIFTVQAAQIAKFALARYGDVSELDSITVADRDSVSPGVWRMRQSRTFSVPALTAAR